MKTFGPLEVLRSPSWEVWRITWHWPRAARHGVWMYRWAICTPWLTLRWLAGEYRNSWRGETP
jgi:hypothetical protein